MDFSKVFDIFKMLIADWRIVAIFVLVLLYLNFIFYIARYHKKKRRLAKRVIRRANPPAAASASSDASGENNAETSEADQ